MLRANGTVVSNRRPAAGVVACASFEQTPALPGDTLFVPEQLDKTTFVQHAKDWTQILAQFALGVAAFVTLTQLTMSERLATGAGGLSAAVRR